MTSNIPSEEDLSKQKIQEFQVAVDKERAAQRAAMPPTERARLDVIEECAGKLEAAGVPFLLWGAVEDGKPDHGGRGWWQFNRMSPHPKDDFAIYRERAQQGGISLLDPNLSFMSRFIPAGAIVVYDNARQPFAVFQNGQASYPKTQS